MADISAAALNALKWWSCYDRNEVVVESMQLSVSYSATQNNYWVAKKCNRTFINHVHRKKYNVDITKSLWVWTLCCMVYKISIQ